MALNKLHKKKVEFPSQSLRESVIPKESGVLTLRCVNLDFSADKG